MYTVHSNTIYPWFVSKTKPKLDGCLISSPFSLLNVPIISKLDRLDAEYQPYSYPRAFYLYGGRPAIMARGLGGRFYNLIGHI